MQKNVKSNKTERKLNKALRQMKNARNGRQVRNSLGSAVEAAEMDVFFFSLNGMVMPLSTAA